MRLFVELKFMDASNSVTQRILCIHKQTPFASGMIRMMPNLLLAVWPPTLLLTRGVSFAFTSLVSLYSGKFTMSIRWD